MPQKRSERRLRRDTLDESRDENESSTQSYAENSNLSKKDFEDIRNEIESKISKRPKDTEHVQREILRLSESLAQIPLVLTIMFELTVF